METGCRKPEENQKEKEKKLKKNQKRTKKESEAACFCKALVITSRHGTATG